MIINALECNCIIVFACMRVRMRGRESGGNACVAKDNYARGLSVQLDRARARARCRLRSRNGERCRGDQLDALPKLLSYSEPLRHLSTRPARGEFPPSRIPRIPRVLFSRSLGRLASVQGSPWRAWLYSRTEVTGHERNERKTEREREG